MKLRQLKSILRGNPTKLPRFILPDGDAVPAHFHVTEVGHVGKNFIDCGGTVRKTDACVLHTYVADDLDHRLAAARLSSILELGDRVLPPDDLEVKVEYDCCVISQYPIKASAISGEHLDFYLTNKHTDCLAKEQCGIEPESACCGSEVCC